MIKKTTKNEFLMVYHDFFFNFLLFLNSSKVTEVLEFALNYSSSVLTFNH